MGAAAAAGHAALAPRILLPLVVLAAVCRCDPDLLFDYCVADTAAAAGAGVLPLNGLACIDPALARADHFATRDLLPALGGVGKTGGMRCPACVRPAPPKNGPMLDVRRNWKGFLFLSPIRVNSDNPSKTILKPGIEPQRNDDSSQYYSENVVQLVNMEVFNSAPNP
uniref:Uncharacterized protein n=1 Tax=Oryza brachyantha TaxID=4533 RepID=J3LKL3_ORYBR